MIHRSLYSTGSHWSNSEVDGGRKAISFMGAKRDCGTCVLRAKCLKNPAQKSPRQGYFFSGEQTQR